MSATGGGERYQHTEFDGDGKTESGIVIPTRRTFEVVEAAAYDALAADSEKEKLAWQAWAKKIITERDGLAADWEVLWNELAEAERDLRTATQVITVANAEVARLTGELDELKDAHRIALHQLGVASDLAYDRKTENAALREVVEAAKKLDERLRDVGSRTVRDQNDDRSGLEMPFPWQVEDGQALKAFRDALAALEGKK